MLICQLLEYEELGWGAIGECFFSFSKKNKDGEERLGTLGDALRKQKRKGIQEHVNVELGH